ncbi:MAG: SRPBCC family protein [Actinomycetes bacterium]
MKETGARNVVRGGTLVSPRGRVLVFSFPDKEDKTMAHVSEEVRVDCPVSEVYNQWTQFEEFPRFMGAIEQVQQKDDTHLHWKANIAGQTAEWDAEITEQVPDRVIAWQATGGAQNQGRVQFQPDGDATRVSLEMEVEPQGAVQSAGDLMGALQSQVRQDLDRFKQLIESRGQASGEWRGEVHGGETQ